MRTGIPRELAAARSIAPMRAAVEPQPQPEPHVTVEPDIDEVIYQLMREADLDPADPVHRATFFAHAAQAEAPVTIDGQTFTPHGVNGRSSRAPVDADLYNESLPDAGL